MKNCAIPLRLNFFVREQEIEGMDEKIAALNVNLDKINEKNQQR